MVTTDFTSGGEHRALRGPATNTVDFFEVQIEFPLQEKLISLHNCTGITQVND